MIEYMESLRKYNPWNGEIGKTGFKRSHYLSEIEQSFGTGLIKVLVGQRRTGKSYILRQIINMLIEKGVKPENICYINMEMIEFSDVDDFLKLNELIESYRKTLNPQGRIYLFIDEIQLVSGWEKLVNSYSQNTVDEFEVYITGSNSTLLSGELATLLSGRYVSFTIFPFSFHEFTEFYAIPRNRESMIRYLKSGGLPELLHIESEEMRLHYIKSLRDTIILRDIVQRYHIKDAWLLESLFGYLVSQTGRLFSVNNIVNYFNSHKIRATHDTISSYLHYLKQTYLIHEIPRYNIKGKEILSGARKFYLNDLAYRNYAKLQSESGFSQNIENLVFLHLLSHGYSVFVGTLNEKEIDFVAERGNEKLYIQVAYLLTDEKVIEREFGNLELINDHYPKQVITMDDQFIGNKNGIKHISVWDL